LWKSRSTGEYFVRTFYTAQTLDQMRDATPLSLAVPPERVPVLRTVSVTVSFSAGSQPAEPSLRLTNKLRKQESMPC